MDLPYRGKITGMGVRKGITLIVGGAVDQSLLHASGEEIKEDLYKLPCVDRPPVRREPRLEPDRGKTAGFPQRLYDEKHKRIALQDHLTRSFSRQTAEYSFQAKGSGKSGILSVTRCGQEIRFEGAANGSPCTWSMDRI